MMTADHIVDEPGAPAFRTLPLRPRERQIADLLLDHFRVPAIGRHLGISDHTVRNHLKNMFRRLGVHSQQELLNLLKQESGTVARRDPS